MKFLEEAHKAKLQFCLLDVHGEGHVLGELGDNVMVVSDRYGIPVVIEAIPIYLEALQNGMSLVVDLKPMFYDDEDMFFKFLEHFLRQFMSLWSKVATPILLAVDEAQEIMPQSPPKGIRDLYKVVKKIVLGGRKSGVHYMLASQRPALIDKTPISQANVRLFGKLEEQADWDAVKRHVKPFSSDEMKELRSGEFILSTEGKATKVKILKRRTTDAGATPSFKPSFSTAQKKEMGDISKRIEELIAKAKEEAKKAEDEKSELKRVQRSLEKSKIREQELKTKLDTIEFISEKLVAPKAVKKGVAKMLPTDPKKLYDEVRSEFDKELAGLRKKYQKEMDAKDKEIVDAKKKMENFENNFAQVKAFRKAFQDFVGTGGTEVVFDAPDYIIEKVTAEVLKRVPSGGGDTYTVAPQEALRKDWQKKALEEIKSSVDRLNSKQLKILSFLLATDESFSRTALALRLIGTRKGGMYSEFKKNVDNLIAGHFLMEENKNVYAALNLCARYYAGELYEDDGHLAIVPHIEAHVHSKGVDGNG
jgi:hypothetical protein